MLDEPTTLANVARVIGETLESEYEADSAAVYEKLGIDTGRFQRPGTRIPFATMSKLWREAVAVSGDPDFGFVTGSRARPGDFFVLGHVWLASSSLRDAMERLCRYHDVLTNVKRDLSISRDGDNYRVCRDYSGGGTMPEWEAIEAGYAAFLGLCDIVTERPVRPVRVSLVAPTERRSDRYDALFHCPVSLGHDDDTWIFAAEDLERPLSGSIPEVADATGRIAEEYLASLEGGSVTTAVRQQIVQTLPSGRSDQDTVANMLHRSVSTLQRQLSAEGTTYREILDATRLALAKRYLADDDYSQAQVAFMVGFADQSNFARAFKRWTGVTPGEFRKAA